MIAIAFGLIAKNTKVSKGALPSFCSAILRILILQRVLFLMYIDAIGSAACANSPLQFLST